MSRQGMGIEVTVLERLPCRLAPVGRVAQKGGKEICGLSMVWARGAGDLPCYRLVRSKTAIAETGHRQAGRQAALRAGE